MKAEGHDTLKEAESSAAPQELGPHQWHVLHLSTVLI